MQPNEHNAGRQNYAREDVEPEQYANSNEMRDADPAITEAEAQPGRVSPLRATRWIPQRKAEIVAAIRGGHMSFEEARERYALSMEEYLSWQAGLNSPDCRDCA